MRAGRSARIMCSVDGDERGETMDSITFKFLERAAPCEYHGACDFVRTETVYVTGHIEGRVVGIFDGRSTDRRYTREHGPLDLAAVREARIRAGWSVV